MFFYYTVSFYEFRKHYEIYVYIFQDVTKLTVFFLSKLHQSLLYCVSFFLFLLAIPLNIVLSLSKLSHYIVVIFLDYTTRYLEFRKF